MGVCPAQVNFENVQKALKRFFFIYEPLNAVIMASAARTACGGNCSQR